MKLNLCAESRLAILFGCVFGLLLVTFVPPAITYDGPSHYFRALQVSEGTLRSTKYSDRVVGGELPRSHADFIHALWDSYWDKHDFGTLSTWGGLSRDCAKTQGRTVVEFTNTAVYSPFNYLFQSLGMRLAALVTASPLAASRLGCLLNLLGFVAIVAAAIEVMPHWRKPALLISMSPLILVQAASFSTDAINFAVPFLLLACVWRLRSGGCARPFLLLGATLAVGWYCVLLKPTCITALLCLALIPSSRFGSVPTKLAVLALHLACAGALWYWWNKPNLDVDIARWFEPARPPAAEMKHWFAENPFRFAVPFYNFLTSALTGQLPLMFGNVGGWISDATLKLLSLLSTVFYAGLVLSDNDSRKPDLPWALGMLVQSLATLVLIALTLWLAFGTIGMDYVPYLVGRYLFPVVLGVGIFFGELFHKSLPKVRGWLFWAAMGANGVGLTAILLSVGSRTA